MQPSKSTEKLIALNTIMDQMPLERAKEFDLVWKEVEGVVAPFVHAEFYEEE